MPDSNAVSGENFVGSRAATSPTTTQEPFSETDRVGRLQSTSPEPQKQAEKPGEGVEDLAMASRATTSPTTTQEPFSETEQVGVGRLQSTSPEPQKQAEENGKDLIQHKFPSALKLSLGGIAVFIFAWLTIGCINWVKSAYEYGMTLGVFATFSITIALLGFGYIAFENYRDLKLLKRSQKAPDTHKNHLATSDENATESIKKTVKQALFIPLISPIPLIATVLFIVLGIRMVRGIAVAYGHRPSMLVMTYLLRKVFLEATIFGAFDVVLQGILGNIANVMGKIIAKELSEGVYISLRTARLGMITMSCCRPVKFSEDEQVKVGDFFKEILSDLLKNKEKMFEKEEVDRKKSEVPEAT